MALDFSGKQYPGTLILQAIRYYVSYQLSYRDIAEIFKERGLSLDHATLHRWVLEYAPQLEQAIGQHGLPESGDRPERRQCPSAVSPQLYHLVFSAR